MTWIVPLRSGLWSLIIVSWILLSIKADMALAGQTDNQALGTGRITLLPEEDILSDIRAKWDEEQRLRDTRINAMFIPVAAWIASKYIHHVNS